MIHFDKSRMQEALENHSLWWQGKLGRPLLSTTVTDAYTSDTPKISEISQASCHDFSIPAEQIVESVATRLSRYEFVGDAFPAWNMHVFGPGVLAAMLGAKLDNSSGAVWFFPHDNTDISSLHVKYDPSNKWSMRIKELSKTAIEYFDGAAIVSFTDLGGILDVAASLLGTENLLFALIDEPQEVKRLCAEIQIAWHEAYNDFASVLSKQGCFTDWNMLLSKTPAYVLQSDFTAMIGPDAFKEFALDSIRQDTEILDNTIYHLDGPDALRHLDDLLTLEKLNAIQWQYGAGAPTASHWIDVYQKINESQKQNMIIGSLSECYDVYRQVGGTPYCRYHTGQKHFDKELFDKFIKNH